MRNIRLIGAVTLGLYAVSAISSVRLTYAATTEEKLAACDAALDAKKKEATLCGLGVDLYKEARQQDQKEIAQLRSRGTEWYSNPFTWAAIAFIAGAYVGARVTK